MVDLPKYPNRFVVTEGPRNGITGADIAAPYAMMSKALDNAADAVLPMAMEQAEARGADAVTIGPDGQPELTEMATLGVLGQAYARGARVHYFAQLQTNAGEKYLQLRQQYETDPAQFNRVATEYNKELVRRADPVLRPAVSTALDKLRSGHYMDLTERDFAVAQQNARVALETQFNTTADNLVALARKGGTQSPEYLAQAENAKAILGELGRNPRWGYNPAAVEDKLRRLEDRGRAAGVLSTVDAAYDWVGPQEALRQAEAAIFDPGLRMDEAERHSRFSLVKAHIGARTAEAKEDIREIRTLAELVIKGLYDGVDLEADGDLLRQKLVSLGDAVGAARVTHAMEYRRGRNGDVALPTREWPGPRRGAMDATDVRTMFRGEVERQGLVGVVPVDGPKYGIRTGSADEWANYFTGLAMHESGLNNQTVGDAGQFVGGSRGLLQLSYHDAQTYGLNGGKPFTPEQLADPSQNAAAGGAITKQLVQQHGSIRGGAGRYWGPISREGWTPGSGRDRGLPWQQWGAPPSQPAGLVEAGNIDLANRPVVKNADGNISTVRSISIGENGKDVLIPTVSPDGKVLSNEEAVALYRQSGQHLGKFDTAANATAYAQALSQRQGQDYAGTGGLPASRIAGLRVYAATAFDGMITDAKKSVGKWHASEDDIAFLAGRIFPLLDDKRKRQAVEFIGEAERAGALLDLSPEARQSLRNSLEDAAAGGNQAARAVLLDEEERFAALQRMEQETPLLRGVRTGWIKAPPVVPWQGADDQVAAAMQARGRAAMVTTGHLGRPVSAFEGEDLRLLTGALDAADTSGKVRILGALATLPSGVREATFAKLHDTGAKGAVLAFAGGLAHDVPEVAAGIVRGREALAAEPRFVPHKEADAQAFTEALDVALPASAFSIGHRTDERQAYATMRGAVRARYADLSAAAGDTSGVLKKERLDRAVEDVTGGTVRHNGATILAPKRAMDQTAFDGILLGLTDADLAGARTTSGKPVTAQYLRDSATLESFAPGRYLIRLNRNAEDPQYAAGEGGRPFILRLDDRQPGSPRAWGMPAPSAPLPWAQSNFGREPSGWPGGSR